MLDQLSRENENEKKNEKEKENENDKENKNENENDHDDTRPARATLLPGRTRLMGFRPDGRSCSSQVSCCCIVRLPGGAVTQELLYIGLERVQGR